MKKKYTWAFVSQKLHTSNKHMDINKYICLIHQLLPIEHEGSNEKKKMKVTLNSLMKDNLLNQDHKLSLGEGKTEQTGLNYGANIKEIPF